MSDEYFIFIVYESSWNPRIHMINLHGLDNHWQDKINCLLAIDDNIIIEKFKPWELSGYQLDGYEISGHQIHDENIIKSIRNLTQLEYANNMHETRSFYIYENRLLSPKQLHEKYSNLTSYKEHPIKVRKCMLLTDKSIDTEHAISLRFFASKSVSYAEIKNKLSSCSDILSTKVAHNNGVFSGYGYVLVVTKEAAEKLLQNGLTIDNTKFNFDN